MMSTLVAVGLGGAAGSLARYGATTVMAAWFGRGFPLGTLLVNVVGSFLIGLAFVMLVERGLLSNEWRLGVITGVLGGFTTFSAFSLETVGLLQDNAYGRAALYVLLSVLVCLGATILGVWIARRL